MGSLAEHTHKKNDNSIGAIFFIVLYLETLDLLETQRLDIREGPVVGNQEAAQIFIRYMYDLVFEISFLDINSQNWNTASYLKSGKKW